MHYKFMSKEWLSMRITLYHLFFNASSEKYPGLKQSPLIPHNDLKKYDVQFYCLTEGT